MGLMCSKNKKKEKLPSFMSLTTVFILGILMSTFAEVIWHRMLRLDFFGLVYNVLGMASIFFVALVVLHGENAKRRPVQELVRGLEGEK